MTTALLFPTTVLSRRGLRRAKRMRVAETPAQSEPLKSAVSEVSAVSAVCAPPSAVRTLCCGGGKRSWGETGRLTRKRPATPASEAVSLYEIHETGEGCRLPPTFSRGEGVVKSREEMP